MGKTILLHSIKTINFVKTIKNGRITETRI